jgi:crotonobetaine/carnitine-CoA ligase
MYELKLEDTADRHLGRILELQAQHNGDTVYLITDTDRITYAEANELSDRLASGFASLGVGKGDRVAFLMANRPELVLMCLALNKLGAIWVPICTDYRGEWLRDALSRSRPAVMVVDDEHLERLREVRDGIDCDTLVALEEEAAGKENAVPYARLLEQDRYEADYSTMDYGDTCAILWTSGTTGKSKGVMIAHNNWLRSILQGTNHQYESRPGDIVYCAMPLYNAGAWITCVLRALVMGIGCVIERKFSVSSFMERVKHFGATQTFAVGSMGIFLINSPEREDDADNPLREALIVPMPPAMWQPFEKRFGVHLVTSGLGQSECLLSLNHEHSDVEAPVYALGFEVPDAEVRLFDDEGNEVPDGQPGEICVRPRAPHVVFNGYFDNPEATAAAFRGEWFLTGDMARKDPETGVFFFVDRKKDAVRFAGRNISTMEVESVVLRHPEISEAAAFGIPTRELESEDELKLNVVLVEGSSLSPEDICRFVNDNAPHYFVPRYLEIVDGLPYTPTNKVQKYRLREAGVTETTWDSKAAGFKVER